MSDEPGNHDPDEPTRAMGDDTTAMPAAAQGAASAPATEGADAATRPEPTSGGVPGWAVAIIALLVVAIMLVIFVIVRDDAGDTTDTTTSTTELTTTTEATTTTAPTTTEATTTTEVPTTETTAPPEDEGS